MTRKHKPQTTHKKRPSAHAPKPAKSAATRKAVAAVASLRDKERAHAAALAARKGAPAGRAAAAHGKVNDSPRPADARSAPGKPGDKRPLALERRGPVMPEDRQSQLKLLIARGKEQGYLTYAQVNDHLPSEIVDPEQIEDIVNTINDMGIPVYEKAPDTESLLASEPSAPADEEAIEEAAAALAALDAELGRTTDPVRMYMREMGTVELLTREGEIRIAKRIEEGLDAVRSALALYPPTHDFLLR
ncbi:MAG TPA: RNA polymerase sigma factor region1.1 domain-containing protein, partial [Steroidobacteraceae bacterium]|nr:RNA polymerase sigma factor region1.1 domain-containing protein [Steroidobacteraceae bacterium]